MKLILCFMTILFKSHIFNPYQSLNFINCNFISFYMGRLVVTYTLSNCDCNMFCRLATYIVSKQETSKKKFIFKKKHNNVLSWHDKVFIMMYANSAPEWCVWHSLSVLTVWKFPQEFHPGCKRNLLSSYHLCFKHDTFTFSMLSVLFSLT